MKPLAKEIVETILKDLVGRRGLGQEWGQIDDEIQEEIVATLLVKTLAVLDKHDVRF